MTNQSESIAKLSAALVKAQAEFTQINFDSVNPFLKNRYASLGTIIENTRGTLAKHGLSVIQPTVNENGLVGITTTLIHESGEWISSTVMLPIYEEKGKSFAQVAGSVITYLRRYSLASMLNLYADEDTDGNDKGTTQKTAQQKTTPEPTTKREQPAPRPETEQPKRKLKSWKSDTIKAVLAENLAKNGMEAANMLNLSDKLEPSMDVQEILKWAKTYRDSCDGGMEPEEAAGYTDLAMFGKLDDQPEQAF